MKYLYHLHDLRSKLVIALFTEKTFIWLKTITFDWMICQCLKKNHQVWEGRLKYQIILSLRFFMTIHDHSNYTLLKMHCGKKPLTVFAKRLNCVKRVQIQNFFWPVFSCIRIEYRKIRTRKNSVFGHAVLILDVWHSFEYDSGLSKMYFFFTI